MTGRLLSATTLLAVLGWTAVAAAQPQDPKDRFNEAVALARQKQFEPAIAIWIDLLDEVGPEDAVRVHKALGLAYRKSARLPEAWYHLAEYLKSAPGEDPEAGSWLEEVEAELRREFVKISVVCEPEGATVRFDPGPDAASGGVSAPAYPCPVSWWCRPGKHTVAASAAGLDPRSEEIDVRERGEAGVFSIVLAGRDAAPVAGPGAGQGESGEESGDAGEPGNGEPTVAIAPPPSGGEDHVLEWTLIGSGAAALVAGAILHGLAWSRNEDLHDEHLGQEDPDAAQGAYDAAYDDEVRPREVAAWTLYGVGAAAVAAGAVLMLSAPDVQPGAGAALIPLFGRDVSGAGLILPF